MNRTKKVAMAALALLIGASGVAMAGQGGHHGRRGGGMEAKITAALDSVDATPEQRAVFQAAQADIKAQLKAQRQASKGEHGQMAQLLAADRLDTAALQAMVDKQAEARKAAFAAILPDLVKMHDALTPAQRQTLLAKMTAKRAERMQKRQQSQQQ